MSHVNPVHDVENELPEDIDTCSEHEAPEEVEVKWDDRDDKLPSEHNTF